MSVVANSGPSAPQAAPTPQLANGGNGRRRGLRFLVAVLVLAALAGGVYGYWYLFMRGLVSSDDARFDADVIDISPQVAGTLLAVNAHEGDRVQAGQVLYTLDRRTFDATLSQAQAAAKSAEAQLAVAQANYDKALHGPRPNEIRASEANVARLKSDLDLAQAELSRTENLYKTGAATPDELDRARSGFQSATRSHEQASYQLQLLKEGTRPEDIAAAKAAVELADARLKEARQAIATAEVNLSYTTVVAPTSGYIVRRWRDPGATVQPEEPVLTITDPRTLRVSANIEEKYLNHVALGDRVDIDVDAYPDLHLQGRVERIMRATNSEFSVIPAEGVSGTFIKVSQRVRLRIALEQPPKVLLGPGLSVVVKIHENSAPPGAVAGSDEGSDETAGEASPQVAINPAGVPGRPATSLPADGEAGSR